MGGGEAQGELTRLDEKLKAQRELGARLQDGVAKLEALKLPSGVDTLGRESEEARARLADLAKACVGAMSP